MINYNKRFENKTFLLFDVFLKIRRTRDTFLNVYATMR